MQLIVVLCAVCQMNEHLKVCCIVYVKCGEGEQRMRSGSRAEFLTACVVADGGGGVGVRSW